MRTKFAPVMVAAALLVVGCGEALNNGSLLGPRIESLSLTPDTIATSDTGMTDEYFTATLVVAGFEDEITLDEVDIFIQEPDVVDAVPQDRSIDGNTITLDRIAKSWFAGLSAGTYPIGANVESETESVSELNLFEITVTD